MTIQLTSTAFTEGASIPKIYTCDAEDASPALAWSGVPQGAKSLALIMDDPDAPAGTWNHWLLYDIPGHVHALAQGIKTNALGVSGRNDFGKLGYGGPCPPRGHGVHRYFFRLSALNVASLGLREGDSRKALDTAMRGHVLAVTTAFGVYKRS